MAIGGVLFGFFAGFTYWFPKFTGFHLDEKLNRYAFWCWFLGFLVAFMPLYMLGFMGATRRLDHYDVSSWQSVFISAGVGAFIIFIGACIQFFGLFWSIIHRKTLRDETGGDPWNGRTLEWSIPSPPPVYNFAILPIVDQLDPLWAKKRGKAPQQNEEYEDIHMPINTPIGFYIGAISLILGFALTWHIYWLALTSFSGIIACLIIRLSGKEVHDLITAEEVKRIEEALRSKEI
jgi:cytochrome o ubiquinol oxidase subunit 1